ncbi:MAG: UDP-3-O-(3-hydroxymyristoyl)glucosamine N-acyltransferase, partial [Proteobacteria bacterium]|nr:UDP-3-O-(3-hydroxymyristoyl)glucosamine N-acyltransferase [Pseudomonadota bacterium]
GGVVIGNDCEIGANTTIDRGALEDTVLEDDVRLDNQIQIGHNVHIGAHTAMAGCSAAAGSARIGKRCLIGGGAGILGHLELCDGVVITAMTLVTHSIKTPGEYSSGTPLMDNRSWRKNAARFRQLDRIARRLASDAKDHE